MPFSSGVFSLVSGNPVVTGTTISSTVQNNTMNDIASNGLSICLLKDGTQTPTANIPMGGFRITGLGNATAVSDAPRVSQAQNSSFNSLTTVSGTSTITGVATPTPAAYAEGQTFSFISVGANGAGPTLNVSGLGGVPIFWNGATCTSSMWSTGSRIDITYVSTSSQTGFHIMGHSGFMPTNLLRVRGSIAVGDGTGQAIITVPSADDQILVSTASASSGVAWKSISLPQTTSQATTFTFNGSGGSTGSLTLNLQKLGNWVTLHIPAAQATTGTGSTALTSNTAFAAAFRPSSAQVCVITSIRNNGAVIAGAALVQINADGTLVIQRDSTATAFTDGASGGTQSPTSITYFTG